METAEVKLKVPAISSTKGDNRPCLGEKVTIILSRDCLDQVVINLYNSDLSVDMVFTDKEYCMLLDLMHAFKK